MTGKYEGGDRYLDPDSGILRNKLGISAQDELERAETAYVALAITELNFHPIEESISGPDFGYLIAIHQKLFKEVYDWAGELRTVDISKGATRFASFRFIEREGLRIAEKMAAENWFKNLPHEEFADQVSYYFGELNTLHPFREGNGRALREYIRHIAVRAGHRLTWEGLDREEMIQASISAHNENHHHLRAIILKQMSCC